ncbi:hypothetical protein BHE74_00034701, partial [Ensete ventricosum]
LTTVRGDLNFGSHKMSSSAVGSITPEDVHKFTQGPDHLLVLVHGIGASNSFLELHPDLVGWRTSSIRREDELAKFLVAQVKRAWLNGAGAGVIAHVADSLKQQEVSRTLIAANL